MTKDPVAVTVIGKYRGTPRGPIASSSIICFMSIMEIMDPVVIVNRADKERR